MVNEISYNRICWGSDLHFGFTLGPILLSSIPDGTRIKILSKIQKIF